MAKRKRASDSREMKPFTLIHGDGSASASRQNAPARSESDPGIRRGVWKTAVDGELLTTFLLHDDEGRLVAKIECATALGTDPAVNAMWDLLRVMTRANGGEQAPPPRRDA